MANRLRIDFLNVANTNHTGIQEIGILDICKASYSSIRIGRNFYNGDRWADITT